MPTQKSTLTSKDKTKNSSKNSSTNNSKKSAKNSAQSNKAIPAKVSKQPDTNLVNQTKNRRFLRWCFKTSIKLMLIIAVTIGIYSIYLDSKVRNKFEGQRWQVPIQVFGKIDQLQLNAPININGITETLGANGYKKVTTVTQAGHYAATKNRLIIYRRKFDFGAGIEPTAKILIDVKNNKITQLTIGNLLSMKK